jgi:hypothetical protein
MLRATGARPVKNSRLHRYGEESIRFGRQGEVQSRFKQRHEESLPVSGARGLLIECLRDKTRPLVAPGTGS